MGYVVSLSEVYDILIIIIILNIAYIQEHMQTLCKLV